MNLTSKATAFLATLEKGPRTVSTSGRHYALCLALQELGRVILDGRTVRSNRVSYTVRLPSSNYGAGYQAGRAAVAATGLRPDLGALELRALARSTWEAAGSPGGAAWNLIFVDGYCDAFRDAASKLEKDC